MSLAPDCATTLRICRGALALLGALIVPTAFAQNTVSVGQNFMYSGSSNLGALVMDGGRVGFANFGTGAGFTIEATNATLLRGDIASRYTQVDPHILNLNGTTIINAVAGTGAFPADGMYLSAVSSEGSAFLKVRNLNTVNQNGSASLILRGRVAFENAASTTYSILGDVGIAAGGDYPDLIFRNGIGATFWKVGGTGTSRIDVRFDQVSAKVEAWTGRLWFSAGGMHTDSRFYADTFGTNASGGIDFGGSHTFNGSTLTQLGNFSLGNASAIKVASGTWNQEAFFSVLGRVNIAPGAKLLNTGRMEAVFGGSLSSVGNLGAVFENASSGVFVGSLAGDEFTTNDRLKVVNAGAFTVGAGDTVRAREFVNNAGVLTVDGTLDNRGGQLRLLGGELRGSGIVNGDGIAVGGGPGVAVFNPGNSPGTFTVEGAFELLPGGVLNLEVARLAEGGVAFDRVVASSFFLNGQVNLLVGAGVEESEVVGLSFLDCGGTCSVAYGSNFSFAFPGRPGSTLSAGENGLQITSLAPVPEPGAYLMLVAGLGLVAAAARRRKPQLPTFEGWWRLSASIVRH